MPVYEFRCEGCDSQFELLVPMGKKSVACPHCGSQRTRRELSLFAAHGGGGSAKASCETGRCPSALEPTGGACSTGSCPYPS
jgi:putative FmdB family regulatory protein